MKIESVEDLRHLYGTPSERAVKKQLNQLEKHSRRFIELSPFAVVSTTSKEAKMDASPRGGDPGFAKVLNDKTIILPDFKGNNRVDSLTNIVETGTIGLLFLIPGLDETLRLNGKAYISVSPEHIQLFKNEKFLPKSCIVIQVEEVFMHCAKAFMRSKLWAPESHINASDFPSMGQILKDQMKSDAPAESRSDMIQRYRQDL